MSSRVRFLRSFEAAATMGVIVEALSTRGRVRFKRVSQGKGAIEGLVGRALTTVVDIGDAALVCERLDPEDDLVQVVIGYGLHESVDEVLFSEEIQAKVALLASVLFVISMAVDHSRMLGALRASFDADSEVGVRGGRERGG